ncbi:MAG: hypothetical protein J6A21_11815 [Lentisphaeria bacterium]|nr:hypothetical protein [Lentisphaeria bacterium]
MKDDLKILYGKLRNYFGVNGGQKCQDASRLARKAETISFMEKYSSAHPEASPLALRALLYRKISEKFQPVLFEDSPFYSCIEGNGGWNSSTAGIWLLVHQEMPFRDPVEEDVQRFSVARKEGLFCCSNFFVDLAHHAPPIPPILEGGFRSVRERALSLLEKGNCSPEEKEYMNTLLEGLEAVKRIQEKYGDAAKEKLRSGGLTPRQEKFMRMMAESAARCPWEAPRTFYEALNTCAFVREIMGELDGLRTNSYGRPDAWLIKFYRKDLAEGRLTEEEAYDLICRFLLAGDALYDHDSKVESYSEHENELTLTLGGCDGNGKEVFNDLTRLFLRAYRENDLVYPKPHCRFSASSSKEYLRLITDDILSGRGIYTLNNDDSLIPALRKDGKSLEDARNYCCTGCWDIVVLGKEDNAGGGYFNLAKILEYSLYPDREVLDAMHYDFLSPDNASSFEEFFGRIMANVMTALRDRLSTQGRNGRRFGILVPSPLNSGCSDAFPETKRDFMCGGQTYSPHALSLCFFANFVDSLLAVKEMCFDRKKCSLSRLLEAVKANWAGEENGELRRKVLQCAHWGDGEKESTLLARRILDELYRETRKYENEKGGKYQLGIWVYREFRFWGEKTKALPDGRREGEILSQSLNPSHFRCREPVTTVLRALGSLDMEKVAGNSVVNLMLERSSVTEETFEALVRTFAELKLQQLQLNCADRNELLDAQKHPEKHQNLFVRICGFSAKFVSLSPQWQQEVIDRVAF